MKPERKRGTPFEVAAKRIFDLKNCLEKLDTDTLPEAEKNIYMNIIKSLKVYLNQKPNSAMNVLCSESD